jgi:hypothetical protein
MAFLPIFGGGQKQLPRNIEKIQSNKIIEIEFWIAFNIQENKLAFYIKFRLSSDTLSMGSPAP